MRAALVNDAGSVIGTVELAAGWDDPNGGRDCWTPPAGIQVILSDVAGIGWTWDGSVFTAPAANVVPPLTADQLREQTFRILPERIDIISRLRTATPAQIDTWLTNNVTSLAQARTVLGALIKVFAINAPT